MIVKILLPPVHGAALVKVDTSAAEQIDGVQIVKEGDFVAALHHYPDVAERALSAIKATFNVPEATLNETTIFGNGNSAYLYFSSCVTSSTESNSFIVY